MTWFPTRAASHTPTRGGWAAAVVRGLAALTSLVVMVLGCPAALLIVGPDPRTLAMPSWDGVRAVLTRPDDGTLLLGTLAVIAWLGWAAFTLAVLLELLAVARRLPAPRLPLLGWPQAAAAGLVTAILLMLTPIGRAGAAPLRPDVIAVQLARTPGPAATLPAAGTSAHPGPAAAGRSASVTVTVRHGDTLWSLAEHHLGSGRRFGEIADLNYGRPQPDGDTLTDAHWIQPGWQLAIPEVAPTAGEYVVQPGDTLFRIAAAHLGDGQRYREILALNHGRPQPDGDTLTDADLLHPGWRLRLPTSAAAPRSPSSTDSEAPRPPAHGSRIRPAPDPASPPPAAPPTSGPAAGTPSPDGTPGGSPASPPLPAPASPVEARGQDRARHVAVATEEPSAVPVAGADGITLPGGFLPWSLAGALSAAVAMVWLHRRRRHLPGRDDDDPTDLPEPILGIEQAVRVASHHDRASTLADRVHEVPAQVQAPPGGLCVTGDGAPAAARAALVTALASGSPSDPDHRGEVIIDRATLARLFGPDASAVGCWARLRVADDLDDALALVEAQLLYRARVLDEHAVTDVEALRQQAPEEEALPPVLLIAAVPPPRVRMRARTALALGMDVGITALLVGEWEQAPTARVERDGRVHADDERAGRLPERLAVLDRDVALAALAVVEEAHTGRRPERPVRVVSRAGDPGAVQGEDGDPDLPAADPVGPGEGEAEDGAGDAAGQQVRARLRVLGVPEVADVTVDGRPLRAKAAELAVYLACHRDGAGIRAIGDQLAGDLRLRQADQHVHTNVSNLRHVLGRAAGFRKVGYVLKGHGRYRLDPDAVEVDLWQFQDLIARAATAPPGEREGMLRAACALSAAPLAEGCDYDWVEPHREKVRQQGVEAHLLLADELAGTQPAQAMAVLDQAIAIDRYNEELYRKALRLRHQVGDTDGVRVLHRALRLALADLDAEPNPTTIRLLDELTTTP